ncbi:MAG TPA: M1 family aminopeptidase [Tenuifilaceae bacterium]|nr:M1 family aminopeptidase [Tenuifilaceae bacterium]HPI45214.1 M1 family aminopeptidase [Tenuifilaceae bacterium]HPN20880.1 M1 family aminopeptidase [Tenuifilaceae bacterium]
MIKQLFSVKSITVALVLLLAISCSKTPELGVSKELAAIRRENISNIDYSIYMSVPSHVESNIPSRVEISFELKKRQRVVLDYRMNDSSLKSVTVNSRVYNTKPENGHIVIPAWYLYKGANRVDIDFYAGESSLNRKKDFLYTLLVPDRASTVFPCFDQPDMKAIFNLTLEVPKDWTAVTNSAAENAMQTDTSNIFMFGKTQPLSTYLFAFAAGKFDTISRTENNRKIVLYHRENDLKKVERNLDAIFSSHFHSLNWLESYTGIPYPFDKLDIVLIPDFQYSGMEHSGAIFYRDARLLLDENPSVNQKLGQANLIAHEVAHQWFGNLVTMRWFNDVWLKEVFAGLMADKIVNPQFPEVNHQLSFLLSHYPRAYSVDRTSGSNPIQQNLDNLLFAGTLYGDIIYHKAPIAMMQLEKTMGEELFQKGVQQYLKQYCMANADWNELISVFDTLTPVDLKKWSKAWVEQAEMPIISSKIKSEKDSLLSLCLTQKVKGIEIPMEYSVAIMGENSKVETADIKHNKSVVKINVNSKDDIILLNSNGLGYGQFITEQDNLNKLINPSFVVDDAVARASNLISINELFLNEKLNKSEYFNFLLSSLSKEKEPQTRNYLLSSIEMVWWQFMTQDERTKQSQFLEFTLYKLFNSKNIPVDERKPVFQTYTRIALSSEAIENLVDFWNSKAKIDGITLSEQDLTNLALEIAVRGVHEADSLLGVQLNRITNNDRLAKFRFVKRAVSNDEAIRDDFFHSLFNTQNRRPEPWVTEALRYFNHPLRTAHSIHYLTASLDLLPEIQQTGDIFFPKMWLDATLWGHSSPEAAKIVTDWLNSHPQVSENLKNKLKQSADMLFRKNN